MSEVQSKEIQMVPLRELKPWSRNRNKHSKEQIERLVKIIEYQGWRQPIVVSRLNGFIAAGHGRYEAAKQMGLEMVPVMYQDFESEDQQYAFMVSDNAVAAWAELDLSGINFDLSELGPDFDIEMLGLKNFTVDVSEASLPSLSGGDREPYQQVAFHLHDEQVETVKRALDLAIKIGGESLHTELNDNKNSNAIAHVCETYLTQRGSDE